MSDIIQIIKCEGDSHSFIWKHPCEDFHTGTQLIVHETQEAVFFMNGQALDSFGPGRHTLTTQNMPIAGGLFSKASGDQTPFHCEVYFINKTEQMAIKWGTDSKLEYVEPTYGFPIQLGACGEMSLRVEDGRKLLVKVVGTGKGITQAEMTQNMRAFLMVAFKPYMVQLIKENKINIFEIDQYLQAMSETLHEALKPNFLDYGLALERFFVTTVIKPESDKNYIRFKEIHFRQYADVAEARLRQQVGVIDQQTVAQKMVIEAQGLATKRSIEGYTYQDERGFDVAERVASNQAVGQFTNMGIGMGVIAGIGGTLGNKVGGMLQDTLNPTSLANAPNAISQEETAGVSANASVPAAKCSKCGAALIEKAKFCLNCGEKVLPPEADTVTCPQCGRQVPEGNFCLECGASLAAPVCPNCGKKVVLGAKFCLECGHKLI